MSSIGLLPADYDDDDNIVIEKGYVMATPARLDGGAAVYPIIYSYSHFCTLPLNVDKTKDLFCEMIVIYHLKHELRRFVIWKVDCSNYRQCFEGIFDPTYS